MGRRATIGDWYRSEETKETFEVVALDEGSGTIDIQYYDGTIGEYDAETWDAMHVHTCAAPEDASGAYEIQFYDDTDESARDEEDDNNYDGLYIFNPSDNSDHNAF